jgi:serine/threonine-protein kinase
MGEVWHAASTTARQEVALKFLRDDLAESAAAFDRLEREAENLAAVRSSHVARFLDLGPGYLVMEFVDGESLGSVLVRRRTLAPAAVARLVGECADGLAAAHLAGVLHRDVKPSNILLSPRGAVITDFGVSHAFGQVHLTDPGRAMGTPEYLAPELFAGVPASPSSDVYALGICAWEALVGHPPFRGTTAVQTGFAHVDLPVPPLPDGVPAFLRELVTAMLVKDPLLRPTTLRVGAWARELLHAGNEPGPRSGADTLGMRGDGETAHPRPQHPSEEDQW